MGPGRGGRGLAWITRALPCPLPLVPGQQSSRDEQGACAVLAVHLNTLLGERPVQHREVQGNESDLFMSYFPQGLKYQVRAHLQAPPPCSFSQSQPRFWLVLNLQKTRVPLGLDPHLSARLPVGWGAKGSGSPVSPLRWAVWAAGRWCGVSISQDLHRSPSCHQETLPGEGEEEHPCHRAGTELGQLQHWGLLHPGPGPGG